MERKEIEMRKKVKSSLIEVLSQVSVRSWRSRELPYKGDRAIEPQMDTRWCGGGGSKSY